MALKLNQVLAFRSEEKSRSYARITQLHKEAQKTERYSGFVKEYIRKDEEADLLPGKKQPVQQTATSILGQLSTALSSFLDTEATRDFANCSARADVIVDGEVLISQAPATFLIFLDKQLTDIYTFVSKMPILSSDKSWTYDENAMLYRSETTRTVSSKKVEMPQVVIPPTPEHPGQWTTLTKDITVGWWDTTSLSGALILGQKNEILGRIDKLSKAVKVARESANSVECERQDIAKHVFGYLLGQ